MDASGTEQWVSKFTCKAQYICILSEKLFMFLKQLISYPDKRYPEVSLALTQTRLYLGRAVIFPHFSTQNLLGPLLPRSEANPS